MVSVGGGTVDDQVFVVLTGLQKHGIKGRADGFRAVEADCNDGKEHWF